MITHQSRHSLNFLFTVDHFFYVVVSVSRLESVRYGDSRHLTVKEFADDLPV